MMAKSSKKAPVKSANTITDYLVRKPASQSQSKVSRTRQRKDHSASATDSNNTPEPHYSTPRTSKLTRTVSDASIISTRLKTRTVIDAVEIASTRTNGPISLAPRDDMKRSPSKRGTPGRRKTKFKVDEDVEEPQAVIYVSKVPVRSAPVVNAPIRAAISAPFKSKDSSQVSPHPRKKPRLSSPEPVKSLAGEVVPSSQSDEQELMALRVLQRDPMQMKKTVDEWRQAAIPEAFINPLANDIDDLCMDVDTVQSSSVEVASSISFGSTTEVEAALRCSRTSPLPVEAALKITGTSALTGPPLSGGGDTPPRLSSPSPIPMSPEILDPATKAARIIADIKAKAYATSISSPPTPVAEFNDDLDDSDDEDDFLLWSPTRGKGMGTRKFGITELQPSPSTTRRSSRYGLRNIASSSSPTSKHVSHATSPRQTRKAPNRGPVILAGASTVTKGKAKMPNPLDKLLKEKKLADKRGDGDEAFRLAESAIDGKHIMLNEMRVEGDEVDDDDWTNEDAARKAVGECHQNDLKLSSPIASGSGASDEDLTLDVEVKMRLLGKERGEAVQNILAGDKIKKQNERGAERAPGVPLWQENSDFDEHMSVDVVPVMSATRDHPLISLLNAAVARQDFTQAALLVDSGAFFSLHTAEHFDLIPLFFKLALSCHDTPLNASAFRYLRCIGSNTPKAWSLLSFKSILNTLVRLGAKPSVLTGMDWPLDGKIQPEPVDIQKREDLLYHLVVIVSSFARSGRLSNEDIPDILMTMLLIANDPMSSPALQCDILLAVNELCHAIAPNNDLSRNIEATICTKILHYTATLDPINKSFIVTLMGSGSGRTRRIAEWIAHSIITDRVTVSADDYVELPPLLPVLDELMRSGTDLGTQTPGKFEIHEKTNFVDLRHFVQILATTLSNIETYVEQDRQARKIKPSITRLGTDSSPTMLRSIHRAIENIHSGISDIRAAHLDRSRTKAALKELSMRLHYQLLSANRAPHDIAGTGKPRMNLRQYFSPKK